jgi:hypothetical protein
MERDEVFALLLRQRIPNSEVVDLVARRYPDTAPAVDLVPLALTQLRHHVGGSGPFLRGCNFENGIVTRFPSL